MPVISLGNMCQCSFGSALVPLASFNTTVNVEGTPVVTNTDTSTLITFGLCGTPTNPAVAEVLATSFGTITQAPCKSMIITPWLNTKTTVLACGKPVCTSNSICQCAWGGTISIMNIKNHTVL